MTRRTLVLAIMAAAVVAGCGSKKKEGGGGGGGGAGGGGTKEVTGTLVVDGKPRTITKCTVEKHLDSRITLGFAGGSVSYEDDHLFLYEGDDDDAIMRGTQLTCASLGGDHSLGTSFNEPGWARGKLHGDCSAPKAVKLDVTLECGTLSPEQQKQLDELKADMAKPGGMFGSGSGSEAPAAGSGSAAPGSGSGSAAPGSGSGSDGAGLPETR